MLALLLVSPLQTDEKTPWVKWYTKVYYWALWPLIILLFVAISTRFLEYGWTENRVIIFGLAVWLSGITAYFTFFKRSNIMSIPLSLFVLVAVLLLGPFSAENVAKRSQRNRLESLLSSQNWINEKGEIMEDKIRNSTNDSIKYELSQTIQYLASHFGNNGLDGFLPADSYLAPLNEENEVYAFMNVLEEDWKLPNSNPSRADNQDKFQSKEIQIDYERNNWNEIPLLGAKKAYRMDQYSGKYWIENQTLICEENGEKTKVELKSFIQRLPKSLKGEEFQSINLNEDLSQFSSEMNGRKVVVLFYRSNMNVERKTGKILQFYCNDGFVLEY
jgi:hypothetical protein